MELDPSIYFILIVPDGRPEQASPMQGFAISLCQNSWAIRCAATLPTTIYDLTEQGRETLLARRMSGDFPVHWHGQSPNAIRSIPHPSFLPFSLIILPESELPQHYSDWASRSPLRPTIVAKSGGDLTYSDLTPDRLQTHFLSVCERIPTEVESTSIESARNALKEWKPMPSRQLGYRVGGHNSVTPNLVALTVAGFEDMVDGPFKNIQHGIKPYVDQIVRTSISILEERDRVGERDIQRIFRPAPDVNLFAPSIYPDFMKLRLRDDISREEKRRFKTLCQILDRQKGYAFELSSPGQQTALMGNAFVESRGASDPSPHPVMAVRAQELRLATDAMAALAASEFSAIARMPNEVNRTLGSVRAFSQHYRADQRDDRKRLLAFRQVQARLAAAFPTEFLDLIRRSKTGIRVVSDAHLEWLDIDGLPLAIRKTCSRIPVTPGNLFIDSITSRPLMHLTPEDFKNVLVISALKRRDPIRGFFETAFSAFEPHWRDKLTVQFVETATRDELVRVLNDFSGPMVVFDGHGSHEHGEPAKLHLQNEAVDVWRLSDEIKSISPIVILSACDTHAADRNHATTANGFMRLGARTVLSSVFPLDARSAAIFAARLIYRVAAFLEPAISAYDEGLKWSEVVSGMLRMHLLTDFLRLLLRRGQLDEPTYIKIHEQGNLAINRRAPDPFGVVITQLEEFGLARDVIKIDLETAVANSSVISYLQIGRPETILIDNRERMERQLESYRRT